MQTKNVRLLLPSCCILLLLVLQGCSIVRPVGNFISRTYENMVSYFNAYYNASNLFDEAKEEIKLNELQQRGKEQKTRSTLTPSATQKLNKVIDKCSNILAFHSTSSLVDDAVLLIGKSFYLLEQYEKSERKFAELIVQFSQSDLVEEAQHWYALSLYKQGKYDDALEIGKTFLMTYTTRKSIKYRSPINSMMGDIYRSKKNYEEAIKYYTNIVDEDDGEFRLNAMIQLGEIALEVGDFSSASQWFISAYQATRDPYYRFYSQMQAAIAHRLDGRYHESLELLTTMIEDARMKEYRGNLYYERGKTFLALNDTNEALADFVLVDTGYAKTQWSPIAAFELGKLYEYRMNDYNSALNAYTRASKTQNPLYADSAQLKVKSFNRYFDAHRRMWKSDSLLNIPEITTTDTTVTDTVYVKEAMQVISNKDSLLAQKCAAFIELGDIFYSELMRIDSATIYYIKALESSTDSSRFDRIYYMLGLIAQQSPEQTPLPSDEYFNMLIRKYPRSPYVNAAKRFLGHPVSEEDPAEKLYIKAERLIDEHQYYEALRYLATIENEYPLSRYAPMSAFAKAWIYEHLLHSKDSAVIAYKNVRTRYPSTAFASISNRRVLDTTELKTLQPDTVHIKQQNQPEGTKGNDEEPQSPKQLNDERRISKPRDPVRKYPRTPKDVEYNENEGTESQ